VGLDLTLSPGSKSSARLHMPHAREPGDLGGGLPLMVDGGLLREGQEAAIRRGSEESDAGMVPRKSAKTWVTPVVPMVGRAAAKGKPAPRNALRAQDRQSATTP
jgi:hypothetical protein